MAADEQVAGGTVSNADALRRRFLLMVLDWYIPAYSSIMMFVSHTLFMFAPDSPLVFVSHSSVMFASDSSLMFMPDFLSSFLMRSCSFKYCLSLGSSGETFSK